MKDIVSIVVPVYNAEKTLERCVHSLLKQSYSWIEVILVNDGSEDGSLKLCYQFSEKDDRVVVTDQPNGGVSSARNTGLDVATGKYIMFCDSDDWVHPDWCKQMLDCHEPGDMAVCQYNRWDGKGDFNEVQKNSVEVVKRHDFLHYPMWMCSPGNKLFQRDVIEENGIRFSRELSMGEDFCFVLDYLCAIQGVVRFLSTPLYYYDVSTESSLSKRVLPLEQCELLYDKITAAMEKLGAVDDESQKNRDRLIAPHVERIFRNTAEQRDLSLRQKLKYVNILAKSRAITECRSDSIVWGNPVYLWFYRHRFLRLAMEMLLIKEGLNRICKSALGDRK